MKHIIGIPGAGGANAIVDPAGGIAIQQTAVCGVQLADQVFIALDVAGPRIYRPGEEGEELLVLTVELAAAITVDLDQIVDMTGLREEFDQHRTTRQALWKDLGQ